MNSKHSSNLKPVALFALGFRPFFLGAAIAGAGMIPVWVLSFAGLLVPPTDSAVILWHAHEMVFGFVAAVIAGFLLTASQNWSGRRGLHGGPLAALFALWLAARAFAFLPAGYSIVYSAVDISFFPMLAAALWPYLARRDQRKHWIFFALIALLFAANLLFHLETHGLIHGWLPASHSLAVHTVIAYLTVIGGRVIPFFTKSALPAARVRLFAPIEIGVLPLTLLFAGLDFLLLSPAGDFARTTPSAEPGGLAILRWMIAGLACGAHCTRLVGWGPWQTRAKPILWILYCAYAMIGLGFALHAAEGLPALQEALNLRGVALHAFTAGAMGLFIYGMISRVALGHTGRPIQAAPVIVGGYILLLAAVALRVLGPIVLYYAVDGAGGFAALSTGYSDLILAAGLAWTVAYLLLLVSYAPLLLRARADGKPG